MSAETPMQQFAGRMLDVVRHIMYSNVLTGTSPTTPTLPSKFDMAVVDDIVVQD